MRARKFSAGKLFVVSANPPGMFAPLSFPAISPRLLKRHGNLRPWTATVVCPQAVSRFRVAIPDTRLSLLIRLREPDDAAAWERFVGDYGPLVYGFGLRRGVPEAEADDFTQEVMLRVMKSIGRLDYDPALGTFRSWLFQVARFVLMNRLRHAGRRPLLEGGSEMMRSADASLGDREEERMRNEWELEYRRQIFAKAAAQVEAASDPEMWSAFWRTAVLDEDASKVASDLGIALGTLYVRRSRVLAKVREAAETIAREWEREAG